MINLRNVRSCPVLNLSDEALKSNIWSKVESMVLHMLLFKKKKKKKVTPATVKLC